MRFVTLVGKPGAGKTTAAREIAELFHLKYVSSADRFQQASGLSRREELIAYGNQLQQERGPAGVASFLLESLNPEGKYVLDRMILVPDITYVRSLGGFTLLVDASPAVCRARIVTRNDPKDNLPQDTADAWKQAQQIYAQDATDLTAVQNLADYVLDTERARASTDEALRNTLANHLR